MIKLLILYLTIFLLVMITLYGCTNLFFQPMQQHVSTPESIPLEYENIFIPVENNIKLHGWFLPATTGRGTIIFLHGNGENISTHIASVHWLPAEGFSVFLYDFRGYGKSTGNVNLKASIKDTHKVIEFIRNRPDVRGQKLFLFGQSLGAVIAINAIAEGHYQKIISAVIVDSGFSSFRKIAREKLALSWILWPFQYPLSWTVTGKYNPIDVIAKISPIPLLIIHGTADNIIPNHHSKKLFLAAKNPKEFWEIPDGKHIQFVLNPSYREKFVQYLQAY